MEVQFSTTASSIIDTVVASIHVSRYSLSGMSEGVRGWPWWTLSCLASGTQGLLNSSCNSFSLQKRRRQLHLFATSVSVNSAELQSRLACFFSKNDQYSLDNVLLGIFSRRRQNATQPNQSNGSMHLRHMHHHHPSLNARQN